MRCVPVKVFRRRRAGAMDGRGDPMAGHAVVVPAVLELLAYPPANLQLKVAVQCHVTLVEERVQIAPKQEAVSRIVRPTLVDWLDVRRLEHGKSSLARNHAAAVVQIG